MSQQGNIPSDRKRGVLLSNDNSIAQRVASLLSPYASLSHTTDLEPVSSRTDFLLAHSQSPIEETWLQELRTCFPEVPVMLLRDRPADEYLRLLHTHGIRHLLSTEAQYMSHDLASAVRAAISPSAAFDLATYLDSVHVQKVSANAASEADRNDLREQIPVIFGDIFSIDRISEIQLCFDELLNNCFYHSFRDNVGTEKYDPASFICLMDGDEVTLEFASNAIDTCLISITDNAGSLIPGRLMTVLDRQSSRAGIFDERGRGFYLMRSFSQRMVVNIQPGVRTYVTLLFRKNTVGWKPLEINCFYNE